MPSRPDCLIVTLAFYGLSMQEGINWERRHEKQTVRGLGIPTRHGVHV